MQERPFRVELTPVSFLRRSAEVLPGKTAVVHEDRRYSYRELEQRVHRLASALRAAGLETGDRVAFLCPNIPAMLEGHYGVPMAGGVLVPINTRLESNEVGYIVEHSGARFVFGDAPLMELVEPLELDGVEVIRIDDTGQAGDPYEDFLASGSDERPPNYLEHEDDLIAINYTSGTTGQPKGATYSHRGAYLQALDVAFETRLNNDSVHLWTLPMFHCNGWCFTWGVTAAAATHVCLPKVDPARIWQLIEAEGVTHYSGAPTIHISIANHPDAHAVDPPVLVPTGGAPPSPKLLAQMESLNLNPLHLYGLTESYGPSLSCTPDPAWEEESAERLAELRARQGQALMGPNRARVVDEQMEDVPRDAETVGEIVLRGNTVMTGYFKQPNETEEAFRGGWFHSGDLAVMHADGYIDLRDRMKDIIISGGENISTIEVERAVGKHEAVLEAAVIPIPDEKWGERPKAFVELKEGASATEEEIIAFCRENLARFKCPAAVEFGELPKTGTGKVQKFLLREQERLRREERVG